MLVQFHVPREVQGKDYSKGIHEMPDELSSHPYLNSLVQENYAVILEPPKNCLKSEGKVSEESIDTLPQENMNEVDASIDSKLSPEVDESIEDQSIEDLPVDESDEECKDDLKKKKSNTRQSHNKKGR